MGGLTVARSIIDQLPDEDVIYVGDTANGPYGPLTTAEVRTHALAIGDDLVGRGSGAGDRLQHRVGGLLPDARERYAVPVVGDPARRRRAVASTRSGRVGVIGTTATIASGAYQDAFRRPPTSGHRGGLPAVRRLRRARGDQRAPGAGTGRGLPGAAAAPPRWTPWYWAAALPLLSGVIQLVMGDSVILVSSAEETAKDLLKVLTEQDLLRPHPDEPLPPTRVFETTGDPEAFTALAARFLGPVVTGVHAPRRTPR